MLKALSLTALLLCNAQAYSASAGMPVTARIGSKCNITPASVTLAFGTLSSGDKEVFINVPTTCISGTKYAIEFGPGLYGALTARKMRHNAIPSAELAYTISATPSSGTSTGSQNIRVTGKLLANDYKDLPIGNYADTVIMRINP